MTKIDRGLLPDNLRDLAAEAAARALEIQRDLNSIATVFDVCPRDRLPLSGDWWPGHSTRVGLSEDQDQ